MPLCQLLSRPFFVWPSFFYPPEAFFCFFSEICFQQICRCSQDLWHKARSPESHFEIHNSTLHQFYTAHIGFAMNSHGTMYDGILGWSWTPTSYYSWISNPLQLVCTHFFRFPADQQTSRQVAQVNTRNCSASFFFIADSNCTNALISRVGREDWKPQHFKIGNCSLGSRTTFCHLLVHQKAENRMIFSSIRPCRWCIGGAGRSTVHACFNPRIWVEQFWVSRSTAPDPHDFWSSQNGNLCYSRNIGITNLQFTIWLYRICIHLHVHASFCSGSTGFFLSQEHGRFR